MLLADERIFRRILMLSVAGTRGGPLRLKILFLLDKKPMNTNQLSRSLRLDYKTVQHHIRVLQRSGLIADPGKKYANAFALSSLTRSHHSVLEEIWAKLDIGNGE